MRKPVYVFSGFLDSGKTSVIKDTLLDPRFNQGERTLIIAMEEGDVDYDDNFLKQANCQLVTCDLADFNFDFMEKLETELHFNQVFIELNGLSDDKILYENGFIDKWELAQTLTVFDSEQFAVQLNNLRQFVYNHVIAAEVAIFNRCENIDRKFVRNNLKAINPRLEIIFEDRLGNVNKDIMEDLFVGDDVYIEDLDYGLWYMDALDNPLKYENRIISINVMMLEDLPEYDMALIMGRRAMVCCADDIASIGITCVGVDKSKIEPGKYYRLKGHIHCVDDEQGYKTCLLYVDEQQASHKPEHDLVNFN